ncbi:MAG: single-stranded DNA-binding protein [Clostridiales bacterium]|nr:single-stranded DNA-binding protein [Clostridiales bacterium]
MNSVNIIGRLVKDPDIKHTSEGLAICDIRIAIDDVRSKEDRADFVNVTVFGTQAGLCEKYLRKGFVTGVSGHIRSDSYTDSAGVKRYPVKLVAENVQFLQWPDREEAPQAQSAGVELAEAV